MIPIYSALDIKAIEQETMRLEDMTSDELMERAAKAFVKKFLKLGLSSKNITVFCGFGNNGGDGLAIAHLLYKKGYAVSVYILYSDTYSPDWHINNERLLFLDIPVQFITDTTVLSELTYKKNSIFIDALWGYGLSKPVKGLGADLIDHINLIEGIKIAVDMPSGICADATIEGVHIIADYTLTFEWKKRLMYLAPEAEDCGEIIIAPLHFSEEAIATVPAHTFECTEDDFRSLLRPRLAFSHKRDYGHVCLITGSTSMSGAAALCSKACVTAGAGLTTSITAEACVNTILAHTPETMTLIGGKDFVEQITIPAPITVIAAGPGLGREMLTTMAFKHALTHYQEMPWILDADALNIIAENNMQSMIPKWAILTPHAGEFDRLFGKHNHDNDRINTAIDITKALQFVIVLKGHHTAVINNNGDIYFNTTGNAGLAKGGSGDVLTGMLAALRAQKYNALETALLGVYLHGLSADMAADNLTEYCVTASQLISYLPYAFKKII